MTFHDLCGKEISARGFAVHCKHCKGKDWKPKWKAKKSKKSKLQKNIPGNEKENAKSQPQQKTTSGSTSNHRLIKINLNGEFETMTEKINPKKKDEGKEMKYECAACGHQFNNFAEGKTCPGCGCEF